MPHISPKTLDKHTLKLIDSALMWTFSRLKGRETDLIFDSLITPTERLMLAKRLGILYLLKENETEPKIAEILKVRQATVSRIRLQHTQVSPQTSNFLFRKLSNWREFTAFKNALKEIGLEALKVFSRGMAGKI
ncbi:hypothetical protein HYZ78_00975 [Candidatus Microgenomates bacterium]|nr:hypothetical protein [Candidatus Microgenomates bacterium]